MLSGHNAVPAVAGWPDTVSGLSKRDSNSGYEDQRVAFTSKSESET